MHFNKNNIINLFLASGTVRMIEKNLKQVVV